ncbi:MAG: thiamine diphosphokinase [Bacteroidota bacterium]
MRLPEFKSLLCLNGRLPARDAFEAYSDLPLVCADGAGNKVIALSLTPDLLIGDLDSVDLQKVPAQCEVLRRIDQNKTDFKKCLIEMDKRGLLPCLIFGISGGELDHTLNNLNCFMQSVKKYQNVLYDIDENGCAKWGFALDNQSFELEGQLEKRLSILPYPEVRLTTSGLEWNLENETLAIDSKSSVRNRVKAPQTTITVHRGSAIVLIDA